MLNRYFFFVITILFFVIGCSNETEDIMPDVDCTNVTTRYVSDILPIIEANCAL